ncbi:MAG TPA: hypothetical protein VFH63_09610 [candidate division Zixibacteria bacterium]|nr:hypothetical protein [candidate division Zixibacteria bacterium]
MTERTQPPGGVAAATAAVIGFFVAAVFPRATWPLIDGDVWWHIRAGEEVLRTGAVPRMDTWSIAGAGREWTSQDWLANVILALGENAGPWGYTALSVLFGALTVLAFWILWRAVALRYPQAGWASRVVWLAIGLTLAGPVMGVRVQVLDLLLATVVIWTCWRYLVDPRRRWLVLLPLTAAIWANLHAGWVLLFLLGGAVLVGEAIDRLLRRRLVGPPPLTWTQLRDLAAALVVSAAALVVNPNGIDLYGYPFMTVGITALNRYVLEWFPASLDTLFGWLLLGFVVVGVLPTLVFGRARLRTSDAFIIVGVTIMAWQAIRFLLIAGPIGAAVAAVVLSPVISATRPGRRVSPILARLARPRQGSLASFNRVLTGLLVVIGLGVALLRVNPAAQAQEIARGLPVAAVRWMDEHDPGDRIFNRYEWGGYIGQHRPDEPIFMDGRADVYGDELLQMYVSVIGVQGDPQEIFDRYEIDHVLIPPDWDLAGWLDASSAWERVYADEVAVIWVRAS